MLVADTNIRKFLKNDTLWSRESHGAALTSLATVFSTVIDRVLIPATHTFAVNRPWGSHPLLDEHWSTHSLTVTHVGAEASRVQKIQAIADDEIAQRNLRVCYKQFTTTNCCRCAKCLRTMAALTALGRLEKFTTFHEPLDLDLFGSLEIGPGNSLIQVQWLHDHFVGTGDDGLAEVTEAMIQRYRDRQAIAAVADYSDVVITAIVFIQADVSRLSEIAESIADITGVSEVYSVTGDLDLLAMVRVRTHEEISDVVADQLNKVDGVLSTQTQIAFRTFSHHDLEDAFSIGL